MTNMVGIIASEDESLGEFLIKVPIDVSIISSQRIDELSSVRYLTPEDMLCTHG